MQSPPIPTDDAPLPPRTRPWSSGHALQLYESEAFLLQTVGEYLADGIRNGQPVLIIVTAEHRRALADELRKRGIEPDDLVAGRDLVWLDARETLGKFTDGSTVVEDRFERFIGSILEEFSKNRPYVLVRAFGEMVDLLWKDGNPAASLALAQMWNSLATRHSFYILHAQAIRNFASEGLSDAFAELCAAYHVIRPTETYLNGTDEERLRQIAILQQRALVLETEVARRRRLEAQLRDALEQRRHVEDELRRRELELRDFLENGLEPMHWVAADGTIIWANRAELEMLGYARDEFVGHHVAKFHADQNAIARILERLARGEDLLNVPAVMRHKDGSTRRVLINSNVYWQDGKFVHTRCFTRNVTDLAS